MKRAFDANVSRARPRVRQGPLAAEYDAVEALAEKVAREEVSVHARPTPPMASAIPDLAHAVRARAQEAKAPKASAVEALQRALDIEPRRAAYEPPPAVVEVQTAPSPAPAGDEREVGERRERLKERLKAVRENPRPEPLPDTVAEAGVLAVERISALQTEVLKVRTVNLALTQDLEASRRQSERATEEARLRMDEARRLSAEMEGRAKLLDELERELGTLEGERNEALLALQESRQLLDARDREKDELKAELGKQQQALHESLSEEERLASELEQAQDAAQALRRTTDGLRTERDTLARQVGDLTRERAELLEARKALEAVHRALAHAAAR
jgi:DNA repair exonuclease SbcCD ATPase subunit